MFSYQCQLVVRNSKICRSFKGRIDMEYIEEGRTNIIEQYSKKDKKKREKPVLQHGSIVYCKGHDGTGSFYGIVYENGVLELNNN